MGWSIGYDSTWDRDIGYGVPAWCDHPECNEKIDRGLSYVCARQQPYGGDQGCGLYFCSTHHNWCGQCERCAAVFARTCIDCDEEMEEDLAGENFVCPSCEASVSVPVNVDFNPFPAKPDHPEWIRHKLTHESWAQWRSENPKEASVMQDVLRGAPESTES